MDLHVHVDRPEPLFAELLTNTLDIACFLKVRTPPGRTVEPLGEEEFVIFASPQHPLAGRRRVTSEELSAQPFVVSNVAVSRELFEAKLRAVGVTPRIVTEARNYDAVNELVDRNVGFAMNIEAVVVPEIAAGRFVPLRLDCPPIVGEIVAALRPRAVISPLVQEFIRFMCAELNRRPTGEGPEIPARSLSPRGGREARRPRRPERVLCPVPFMATRSSNRLKSASISAIVGSFVKRLSVNSSLGIRRVYISAPRGRAEVSCFGLVLDGRDGPSCYLENRHPAAGLGRSVVTDSVITWPSAGSAVPGILTDKDQVRRPD